MADDVIEVMCFNFPDGTTYWAERLNLDAEKVMQAWRNRLTSEQRELYLRHEVFGAFVLVRMLREAYQRIPATNSSHAIFEAASNE